MAPKICVHFSFDGSIFIDSLKRGVPYRKKRAKSPRKIRYFFYCMWAKSLLTADVGPSNAEYAFPSSVLDFIRFVSFRFVSFRFVCPGDIKGEIRDDAYPVSSALEISKAS